MFDLIAIDDWQFFLCYWRSTTPVPKLERAFPRWPNSYINLFKYTPQIESYLRQEGLKFHCSNREDYR